MSTSTYFNAEAARETHWMKPHEVRTPVTAKEAEAALDMIDTALGHLESIVTRKEAESSTEWTGMRRLIEAWETKRAEVAYAAERLEAGEPALSIELAKLRAQVAALTAENELLKARAGSAKAQAEDVKNSRRERLGENAHLKRQNADLIEKNARLAAALQEQRVATAPPPDEVKRTLKRSLHTAFAFGAEAMDELVAAGVTLTPLAAMFARDCNNGLPGGYRAEWRATDGSFKRAAADARAARGEP